MPDGLGPVASRQWIKENWYTGKHRLLSYDSARIYMFGFIDNYNDSVECVYSGFRRYLPAGTNNVTYPEPVNTEHTVPQSFFASQLPMHSDLFHLFPVFETWNVDRGNNPFSDIPDHLTQKWIYRSSSQTTIPVTNIDLYSEYLPTTFEPREQHKGDLARAVFYFFTMYTLNDRNINNVAAINTLCLWARNDPPDSREIERNNRIENYQGNRNPYIDRPEWLMQAWGCTDIPLGSGKNSVTEQLKVFPNPATGWVSIEIPSMFRNSRVVIFDISGNKVRDEETGAAEILQIDMRGYQPGMYIIQLLPPGGQKGSGTFFLKN